MKIGSCVIGTCLLDIRHLLVTDDKAIKFGSNLIKMNKQILGIFPTVTLIIVRISAFGCFLRGEGTWSCSDGKNLGLSPHDSQLSHTVAGVGGLETTV